MNCRIDVVKRSLGLTSNFDEVNFNGVLIGKIKPENLSDLVDPEDDSRLDGSIYNGIIGIAKKANYKKCIE